MFISYLSVGFSVPFTRWDDSQEPNVGSLSHLNGPSKSGRQVWSSVKRQLGRPTCNLILPNLLLTIP